MTSVAQEKKQHDFSNMSVDEIEAVLAKRKKDEQAKIEKERDLYERQKYALVEDLIGIAFDKHQDLKGFKHYATTKLNEFYEKLKQYGDVQKGNKGSFSIMNEDRTKKVEYKSNTLFGYDERGDMGAELIKEWLTETTVKKKDKDKHDFMIALLDKTKGGGYDPRNIGKIYKFESKPGVYQHEKFQKAVSLFKESYVAIGSKYYINFQEADAEGEWHSINLNWSSIANG